MEHALIFSGSGLMALLDHRGTVVLRSKRHESSSINIVSISLFSLFSIVSGQGNVICE